MDGPLSIDVLYAYIVETVGGAETVPSVVLPEWDLVLYPIILPLIAATGASAAAMRRYILNDPNLAGKRIKLVRYERTRVVDIIDRAAEGNQKE